MSTLDLERLRQPEYTGENRCIPCTVTNVVITVGLVLAVWYGWTVLVGSLAWLVGGLVLVGGLAAIWLRGYLVPGTPTLTKQYFPESVLRVFDKEPTADTPGGFDTGAVETEDDAAATAEETAADHDEADTDADAETAAETEEIDAEELLLSAGVVTPCANEDDLCMTEGFRVNWRGRMTAMDDDGAEQIALAHELDLEPEEIEFTEYGNAFVALNDGQRLGQWESQPALVADLAAARELPRWVDGWEALPVKSRSQLLSGLRVFLDDCPGCDGSVSIGVETVESCCRSREVVATNCEGCDARLLEMRYQESA